MAKVEESNCDFGEFFPDPVYSLLKTWKEELEKYQQISMMIKKKIEEDEEEEFFPDPVYSELLKTWKEELEK
jgi:hypothetical protein